MSLIVGCINSLKIEKGDKVQDIKAIIINITARKFWYIKYHTYLENNIVKTYQASTKVLKTEKNLKYMRSIYLPAWISRKKDDFKIKTSKSKKFSYYFSRYLKLHNNDKSYFNRIYVYNKTNDYFGNLDVSNITRLDIKDYLASLEIKNSSKRDYLNCIKGVIDIALDDEVVEKNVAQNIRFKRESKAPIKPFSIDEVILMLEKSDGMFRNYIGISLNSGLRSGEILGLMNSDILEDRICVRRSVSKGRVTAPKTLGSVRDIPMFEALRPYLESQKQLSKSLYLFDFNKTFIKDASFFKRKWHQLVEDCSIEYRKLYTTRHTFITAMLNSEKYKIMEIAALVGHTSPEMIMKNYAGFIKDSHLMIDTSINLYDNNSNIMGNTLGNTKEIRSLENV